MASYVSNSPIALALADFWGPVAAKQKGTIYKSGVHFGQGVDQATADDFFSKLGVHHPTGHPIPKPIAAGTRLNSGEYVVTGGDSGQSDWSNYDPSDATTKYTKISDSVLGGGRQIWKRVAAPATTPAPQGEPPKPYEIDAEAIGRAKDLAAAAKDKYNASIPGLNTGLNPYESAADFGRRTQESLMNFQDWRKAEASAQTTEISEAGKNALSRFAGKVEDYKLPNWRDYLNA